jgi:hypothetical protein
MLAAPPFLKNFDEWAEDAFQSSGSGHEVTINPPRRDKRGWDFLAEWDIPPTPGLPLDKQRISRSARVQVKSRKQPKPVARINLLNAQRFAEAGEPCFIVLYHLNREKTGVSVYARHFDDELVGATLKRAREADRDGRTDVHNIELQIQMHEKDLHTTDLILWIKEQCAEAPPQYQRRKSKIYDTIGFDEPTIVGSIKFATESAGELLEQALGLGGDFNPEWVELREARFGIPGGDPLTSGKPDSFEIKVHPKPATALFSDVKGDVVEFDGDWRAFSLPGFSPSDSLAASFSAPYIVGRFYNSGRMNLRYNVVGSDVVDLRYLIKLLRLFMMASDGPLTIGFRRGEVEIGPTTADYIPPEGDVRFYRWALRMVEALAQCLRAADKPRISLAQIVEVGEDVERFVGLLSASSIRMTIETDGGHAIDNFASMIGYAYVQVAGWTFGALLRKPLLYKTRSGNSVSAAFGQAEIQESWSYAGSIKANLPKMRRRFAALRKRSSPGTIYPEEGDVLLAIMQERDIRRVGGG